MNIDSILANKGRDVRTIAPSASVADATRRLRQEGIGALVVTAATGDIIGIVSDRGILWALADQGVALMQEEVRAVMTSDVITCRFEDPISDIMAIMTEKRVRHIPVVDRDGRLDGIVSIGDIVKHRLDEIQLEAESMREYITNAR